MTFARARSGTLLAVLAVLVWAVSAFAAPFTTAPKSAPAVGTGQAELFGLAAGCHATYDRVVLRSRLGTPGYDVRYVTQPLVGPSGLPTALLGTKHLRARFRPARGHSAAGAALLPATLTPHCRSLRQIKVIEDFEGIVVLGLGIQGTKGFKVYRLTAPPRIVVDIAH